MLKGWMIPHLSLCHRRPQRSRGFLENEQCQEGTQTYTEGVWLHSDSVLRSRHTASVWENAEGQSSQFHVYFRVYFLSLTSPLKKLEHCSVLISWHSSPPRSLREHPQGCCSLLGEAYSAQGTQALKAYCPTNPPCKFPFLLHATCSACTALKMTPTNNNEEPENQPYFCSWFYQTPRFRPILLVHVSRADSISHYVLL